MWRSVFLLCGLTFTSHNSINILSLTKEIFIDRNANILLIFQGKTITQIIFLHPARSMKCLISFVWPRIIQSNFYLQVKSYSTMKTPKIYMVMLENIYYNSDTTVRPLGNALCTFRVTWSGHRKILSLFDLQPKNESTIRMPRFYWILLENFGLNFDSDVGSSTTQLLPSVWPPKVIAKFCQFLETLT